MKDAEPTGTVYKEAVDSKLTLTESNGATIQNQLTDGDLNSYNCGTEINYLSRSDWSHTFPTGIGDITATEEMIRLLRNEIYDKEGENAAYDGPTEFTYGADQQYPGNPASGT